MTQLRKSEGFQTTIALATTATAGGVLFISLEMSQEQSIERGLCAEAGDARTKGFTPEQDAAQQKSREAVGGAPARLPISARHTAGAAPSACTAVSREHPNFGLLAVDYLNEMESGRREDRCKGEVATITMALQHLAGELRIAVLALSQFNRGPAREDRAPRLSDLRDSGAIEQDATIVMFLHEKKADDDGNLDIIIAKNRRGQPWVGLPTRFIASQTRFEDRT